METFGQHLNILLLLGIAIFGGTMGAKLFQRLRIPQVIGFVFIGVILGPVLKIISPATVQSLEMFNLLALGIIGFLVGGELKREVFVRFGRQVPIILFFEGVTAFLLVGIFSFLVMWYFSSWQTALSVAVVFGAICSATDPASTVAVLWEYKARGPLTTMLVAIVTLDDALALVLYAVSIGVVGVVTGNQQVPFLELLAHTLYELAGAMAIGLAGGMILGRILQRIEDADTVLIFTFSSVLLILGVAVTLHMDVILSAMALGVTLINIRTKKTQAGFELMHKFAPPIYVLFFVLVGARVNFSNLTSMIAVLVAAYVTGSVIGKTLGSYLGAVYSGAASGVRKYLGFCLYPQGGIAVGLLIMASHRFSENLSSIMLLVVIIGAFILQIIGPIGVKFGGHKAGELGRNITEEDLIKTCSVAEIMDKNIPSISANMSINDVIKIFGSTSSYYYAVVDEASRPIGAVTFDSIRNTFAAGELHKWLIALDVMEPVPAVLTPDTKLARAMEIAKHVDAEFLPVISSKGDGRFEGILDCSSVRHKLSARILELHRQADSAV